jgi:hypothetical protein
VQGRVHVDREECRLQLSAIPRVLLAAMAAGLCLPSAAQAHSGSAVVALDYRTTIAALAPALHGIEASVQDGDRKLRLSVDSRRTVVVLGDAGEPFLRFSSHGVAVNERSQTALAARLTPNSGRLTLDPQARPGWRTIASRPTFAWHDHRLAPPLPAGTQTRSWSIRLVVDGTKQRLGGEFRRVERPALWPWLLGAAAIVGAAVVVAVAWKPLERTAAVAWAVVAGAAALVTVTSFAFGGAYGQRTRYLELVSALVLALAGAACLVFVRKSRAAIAGILGALAVVAGLGAIGVFFHGVVISALPAPAVRTAALVALCGGAAAVLLSLAEAGHRR